MLKPSKCRPNPPKHFTSPSPSKQIKLIEADRAALEAGLCPYCASGIPTKEMKKNGIEKIIASNKVEITARTARGWAFKCPVHGSCGCNTSDLILCFTRKD